MVRISKEQVQELIKNGDLKNKGGKYHELHITGKHKTGKRKHYYVPDYLLKKLN